MPIKKIELEFHPANPLNEIVADINNNFDAITTAITDLNNGVPVMGEIGPKGDKGEPGVNGVQGERGEPGLPGKYGQDGKDGRDGIDGKDGKDGATGEPGPAGKDGKDGVDGQPGRDGLPGINGKDGKDGLPGRDGIDGKDGKDGLPGKDGAQGIQGIQGPAGKDGTNGKDGAQGAQGIQGPVGPAGAVGPAGPQGVAGPAGATGLTGPAGKDGINGVSITNVAITAGKLIITKSDGTTIDAGAVTSTTTTTTTSTTPVVGGAVNPMASPVGTTTTMKGYIAAYCNAGVFLPLDNIKVSVTTGGSRGLCMATVSGTMTCSISGHYMYSYASAEGTATVYPGANYSTTPSGSFFNWSFGNAGDTSVFHVHDYTNQKMYRITVMIGASYNANFISIERLI